MSFHFVGAFLIATVAVVSDAVAMPGCLGNTTANDVMAGVNFTGKIAIVTGGDSGLGFATAEALARRDATVVVAARNITASEQAARNLSALTGAQVVAFHLDLASLASVHSFAKEFLAKFGLRLHLLVNNAGVGFPSIKLADGFELVFEVDYLGHFLLTELLLPALRRSRPSRVVNVASGAHTQACVLAGWPTDCFKDWTYLPPPVVKKKTFIGPTYGVAKFLQIQHAKGLALREADTGVEAFSVDPGYTLTNSTRPHMLDDDGFDPHSSGACQHQAHPPGLPAQACPFSAGQGAAVIAFCTISSHAQPGVYYDRDIACEEGAVVSQGFTEEMIPELYERSLLWAGLPSALSGHHYALVV